jgi:hypothetical protein
MIYVLIVLAYVLIGVMQLKCLDLTNESDELWFEYTTQPSLAVLNTVIVWVSWPWIIGKWTYGLAKKRT